MTILPEFNVASNDMLSLLIFGGEIAVKEYVECINESGDLILVKSGPNKGQIKTKPVNLSYKIKGLRVKPESYWKTKKKGIYSTKEDVLQTIIVQESEKAREIAQLLLDIKEINKQISTYYNSTAELTYDIDSCVHASFNHVETATGRLGCKKPNIQNQPSSDYSKVKEHFVSRYPDGVLISADYRQLEICVQAMFSGDQNYIDDVKAGIDFHIKKLAVKEKLNYEDLYEQIKTEKNEQWIQKRTAVKAFSFARAYGAGISKLSQSSGLTEQEIKDLIKAEEEAYPRLSLYYKYLSEQVNKTGEYKDPFGRIYKFKKYPAKFYWQKEDSYSPTEIKNYMIQGGATASIVLGMLGMFWREVIKHRDKFLLINTVHDSIMLDCRPEYVSFAKKVLKDVLTNTDKFGTMFNYKFKLKLDIDISTGSNWYELN